MIFIIIVGEGKIIKKRKVYIYILVTLIFGVVVILNFLQNRNFIQILEDRFVLSAFLSSKISTTKKEINLALKEDEKAYDDTKSYTSFTLNRDKIRKITFEEVDFLDTLFMQESMFDTKDYFLIDYAKEKLLYYKALSNEKWRLISLYDSSYFDNHDEITRANIIKYVISFFFFIMVLLALHYIFMKEEHSREKEKSMHEIQDFAHTDKLTHIANRSRLDELLESKIKVSKRFNQTFSIIFFDIDFFKTINDTFGHDVGDNALEGLAKFVLSFCREDDLFGRWGGEEFMIILQNTTLKNAHILANRLRENIENTDIISQKRLTCSFGVVEHDGQEDRTSLIKRVDTLLYKAKNAGRNIVIS